MKIILLWFSITAAFVALAAAQTQPTGRIEGTITLVVSVHSVNYGHISGGHVYLIDPTSPQGASFLHWYQQQSSADRRINFVCERASRFAARKAELILSSKSGQAGTATYSFDNVSILAPDAANGGNSAYEVAGCVEYDYARMWIPAGEDVPHKDMRHAGISAFEQTVPQLQVNTATPVSTVVKIGETFSQSSSAPSEQATASGQPNAAPQPAQPSEVSSQKSPVASLRSVPNEQSAPSPSGNAVALNTRAITVDIVATHSHGASIRDLKPEELEITDNGPQKIAHFAFIDNSANSAAEKASGAQDGDGIFTNQAPLEGLAVPPTVVLLDALNTPPQNQPETRRHMIEMLKTLPENTPVTVLLLGARLSLVQDYRSNPRLLRAALQNGSSLSQPLAKRSRGGPSPATGRAVRDEGLTEEAVSQKIGEFVKEQYTQAMTHRLDKTVDALDGIADYLRGNFGRKNLIWVSSSFPIATIDSVYVQRINDIFKDASPLPASPTPQANVQRALGALSSAQVAIYPIFAGGLQTETGKYQLPSGGRIGDAVIPSYTKQANRDLIASSMDRLAEESGGKVCKNADDLSSCISSAQSDSSSYFELSYYPENVNWDGSFHKITVRTTRRDVKLSYPGGYYAVDKQSFAKQQPQEVLEQTCRDLLPATGIRMTAQLLPQRVPNTLQFRLMMPASLLSTVSDGSSRTLNASVASCQYSETSDVFNFSMWDISENIPDATYELWRVRGIDKVLNVAQASGSERVRLAVLDQTTGSTGAVDVSLPPK